MIDKHDEAARELAKSVCGFCNAHGFVDDAAAALRKAAADEREACARVADGFDALAQRHDLSGGYTARHIAEEIRERGGV